MKLVDTSVRRPVGVIMIVLAILALGFVSLKNLAIDLYPEIDLPIAVVMTSYPSAAPQEVEKSVSKTIEAAVSSIEGVDTIQSTSRPGSSLVILMFETGTNLESAVNDLRENIDRVKGMLPDEAGEPLVMRFDPQQIPVMWVGLTGASPEKLQNIAEDQVQPHFERSPGVASVSVEGGKTREIQLELDRSKLVNYGLSPMQVVQALGTENRSSSPGVISKGDQELQIRLDGEFTSIEDISNLGISTTNGNQIFVSDVAQLKDTFKKNETITKVNGNPALVLTILKKSNGNTVDVADEIYDTIDEVQKKLPEGVKLSVVLDTSQFIRQSISSVVSNMIAGALLSALVLLVFLRSMRATTVIGLSIPIAVISTFALMYFTGQTLNVLSMGGLALGIGMMVDNSIVILESIYGYREKGATIIEAATKGASELASAVIASTTTSLVVFLPIVFTKGMASDLFTPLALTVSFSLIASLIVALTLVPMLSSKMLTASMGATTTESRFERNYSKVMAFYQKNLSWVLSHRKISVITVAVIVIVSFALIPLVGAEFIPSADQGQIQIKVEAPSGAKLEETQAITDQVNKLLNAYDKAIDTVYLSVGNGGLGGGQLFTGSNQASYIIQLVNKKDRELTTKQLVLELNEKVKEIPGAEIAVSEMSGGMGQGAPIQIKITGPEREVLEELGEQVVWLAQQVEGTQNVESSAASGRPEILVDVNRKVAAQFGLSYQQIMSEVEINFNGKIATKYRENGEEVDVRLVVPEINREGISDLEGSYIQSPNGALVPLSAVAELKQVQGPVEISRENQQRQISVTGELNGRDLNSVTKDINTKLSKLNFPDGYSYEMGGHSQDMAESFADLGVALVFSIFLVYAVMAVQFESFVHPFVIMFSMPTTLIGVIIGLLITGKPFSIPAFIGIIMLAGIVVNNAIVLVDYINILRERGLSRYEAILEAGPTRLRPILMTTLTTVLGMVPIALGIGEGSEAQAPLAITIIFGLSTSTMLTLLFVPVMYTVVDDFTGRHKKLFEKINRFGQKVFKRNANRVVKQ